MTKEMTPEQQFAESHKYTSRQYAIIPQPDGRLSLFNAYGTIRTYINTFTEEALLLHIRETYAHDERNAVLTRRHEELIRASRAPISLDSLDLSAIKIEL